MFERARVISLPRRTDRRELLDLSQLGVPWEFRPGIEMPPHASPDPWSGREGHLGCLEAHIAVLSEAAWDQVPTLILEDDTVLHPQFGMRRALVEAELATMGDVDLLYLGGQDSDKRKPSSRVVSACPPMWRTHAYAVSPAGAKTILRTILNDTRARTIDGILADLVYRSMIKAYACSPWLVSVCPSVSDTGSPECPTESWTAPSSSPSRSA